MIKFVLLPYFRIMTLEIDCPKSEIVEKDSKFQLDSFPIQSATDLSYSEFFHQYMIPNLPCLIRDLMIDWPASRDLVNDNKNEPNIAFFEKLEDVDVPVADCSAKYFNSQEKISMTLKEYISYWKSKGNQNDSKNLLYLKDWHFVKQFPNVELYSTPKYFTSDWLNEYWEDKNDDYKFVYLGPKNSWTPFHSDVFGSFSWSANVAGFKKWIFVQKGLEPDNIYDISKILPLNNSQPGAQDTFDCKIHGKIRYFEIIQGPGEVIFVPSGWYHQVLNLTDTLSINHNWFNGTNIKYVWFQLEHELIKVKKEMSDIYEQNDEEWKEMCQKLLLASHGMSYSTFIDLLNLISESRMKGDQVENFGPKHIEFDLNQIHSVLQIILKSSVNDLIHSDQIRADGLCNKIEEYTISS